MDGPPVQRGTMAPLRRIQLLHKGVVHHSIAHLSLMAQGYGDVAVMQLPHKVGGAVDGIDDERPVLRQRLVLSLLTEEIGLGADGQQLTPQELLHRHIVFRHQIRRAGLFTGVPLDMMGVADHVARLMHNGNDLFQHTLPPDGPPGAETGRASVFQGCLTRHQHKGHPL